MWSLPPSGYPSAQTQPMFGINFRREKPKTPEQIYQEAAEQERQASIDRQRGRNDAYTKAKVREERIAAGLPVDDEEPAPTPTPSRPSGGGGSGDPAVLSALQDMQRARRGQKGQTFSRVKGGLSNEQQAALILALQEKATSGDRDAAAALDQAKHRASWAVGGLVKKAEEEQQRKATGRGSGRQTRGGRQQAAPALATDGKRFSSDGDRWKAARTELRKQGGGNHKKLKEIYDGLGE